MATTQPPAINYLAPPPTPQALWETLNPNWLVGYSVSSEVFSNRVTASPTEDLGTQLNQQWFANVETRRRQLQHHQQAASQPQANSSAALLEGHHPLLLIAESDPLDFLASFWAALLSGWNIALADPKWGNREQNATQKILQPTLTWPVPTPVLANTASLPSPAARSPALTFPAILIPTGGTSGQLKFVHHTWTTLLTAATSFCRAFPTPIHTYCVLPVHHVSGLMQVLRAWLSQAQVVIAPFKTLERQPALIKTPIHWYISLVPTQLARLIAADKGNWLSQFRAVLLGGAPPWPHLLSQARQQKIPICLSYGMTETAAMVTVQRPYIAAQHAQTPDSGSPLAHVRITIEADRQEQPPNVPGQIVVRSLAIAHRYYSDRTSSKAFLPNTFYTDDIGYLTPQGQLHVTGRASSKIISGGENIFPAEVEAALHSTGQIKDACVFGQPDPQWGEIVVAAFVPADISVTASSLKAALSNEKSNSNAPLLSRYKHPKRWISLDAIPRNAQGKLLKSALMAQIKQLEQAQVQPQSQLTSESD